MTKHTEKMGRMPAGAIDFDKVQSNARAGKADIFHGAVSKVRDEDERLGKVEEPKGALQPESQIAENEATKAEKSEKGEKA
jgi:hypothetical protein